MESSLSPPNLSGQSVLLDQLNIQQQQNAMLQQLSRMRTQASNYIGIVSQVNNRTNQQQQQHQQQHSSHQVRRTSPIEYMMSGENDYLRERSRERSNSPSYSSNNQTQSIISQNVGSSGPDKQANIEEIFQCFICFGKLSNAVMCPHCSKLCCRDCIKKWLTEQRQSCPHCRTNLRVNQLVNCRFVEEITAAIDTMQTKNTSLLKSSKEVCQQHDTALNYYCNTCKKPICSDCAMFGDDHKQHEFEKLRVVYERHVEMIRKEANGLRKRLKDLNFYMNEVQSTIEKVSKAKDEKIKEIELFVENIQAKLNQHFKSKLLTLLQQKGAMADEIESLEEFHQKLNKELCQQPQSQLINKSNDLVKQLREIHNKPTSKFVASSVSTEFPSELVPNYDSSLFVIREFSRIRHTHEVVYSEPLITNGLTWRLKVYPNGNGIAKGNYISIFLEMLKGLCEPSKYEYRVEMLSSKEPATQQIVREFSSDFEVGECWGYNRFYRIDLLEREGFLSEDDCITLKYFVRAPNYAQQSRDQKKYIESLELQMKSQQQSLNEMNTKYNEAVNKNHKHSKLSKSLNQKKKTANKDNSNPAGKQPSQIGNLNGQVNSEDQDINYVSSNNVEDEDDEEFKQSHVDNTVTNVNKKDSQLKQESQDLVNFQETQNLQQLEEVQQKEGITNTLIDAEQDFGTDQDDEDDENSDNEDDYNNQDENNANMVVLRSGGEWSPKQYSVSSNNDDEDDETNGVSDHHMYQNDSDEEEEDDVYVNHHGLNNQRKSNHDDISVLREILNGSQNRANLMTSVAATGGNPNHHDNYISDEEQNSDEEVEQLIARTKLHKYEEDYLDDEGDNNYLDKHNNDMMQVNDYEEEKENAYHLQQQQQQQQQSALQPNSNKSLHQFKKDFYERSKQLKNAMSGLQQHQQRLIQDGKESAIVSTKEILKSLHATANAASSESNRKSILDNNLS